MPKRREDLYLVDILDACDRISRFLGDMTVEDWAKDDLVQSATLQQLVVLGEAARGLSMELRDRHPEVPWRRMVGFRNVALHEYFSVEWHLVWAVARDQVPQLEPQIRTILLQEYPDGIGPAGEPGAW
jgi:uncharacterized protein with HEPN domain